MPHSINLTNVSYSASSVAFPGQKESGDLYIVKELPEKVLIGVVDGMGHGHEAALAAKVAIDTVKENSELSIIELIKLSHEELKPTRGAVLALASINYIDETISWVSIGNVEGMLLRSDQDIKPSYESIFMCPGVLGYRLTQINASIVPISKGDLLIFSTDGIRNDYVLRIAADANFTVNQSSRIAEQSKVDLSNESFVGYEEQNKLTVGDYDRELSIFHKGVMNASPYKITKYIANRFTKGSDDALVLAVKYLGKK